nr:Lipase 1 precursor [Streptococcus thermophilus]
MTSRRVFAAILAVIPLVLAGCSESGDAASERVTVEVPTTVTVTADPTDLPSSFTHYVALGDSYAAMGSASGPFIGPAFCARSEDNYPHELAKLYSGINAKRGFTDATCQGSTTDHILADRDITGADIPAPVLDAEVKDTSTSTSTESATTTETSQTGTATSTSSATATSSTTATEETTAAGTDTITAQIESLEPDTDLITLSIGGNDIHFGPWSRCITGMVEDRGEADCDEGLYDDTARALVDLPKRLDAIYAKINEKAPNATIITTGYMPLLSMEDDCERTADLPSGTLNWAAGLTVTMNAMVRDAAVRNGALFVMPPNADFHSVCAPAGERWTDLTGEETDSFAVHPTPAGQKAMADAIADVLAKL